MLETIWRPKRFSLLTDAQKQEKLIKDRDYEIAVQNLSTAFYQKKRTIGVTAKEETDYQTQKSLLWNTYLDWAKGAGLYEQVTPEQQLTEAEAGLTGQVEQVNLIRTELKKPLLEIKELQVL